MEEGRMQAVKVAEAAQSESARRMLTIDEVLDIVPVTRGTLYRMEKEKRFPESHYISANRRVWFEDEVIAWQKGLPGNTGKPRGRHIKRR
jgi:predicted DNA-binding transcriptional regulator AlpA